MARNSSNLVVNVGLSPGVTRLLDGYDDVDMTMTSMTLGMDRRWNLSTELEPYTLSSYVKQQVAMVSVVMICTIVGNLVLIFALTCKRSRRVKRVNVFLVNLAIVDLAVALFTNTTEIFFHGFGDWVLGPVVCKISVYIQIVTLASATFLLTAMSLDRYQVIVKPMESLYRRPRIWVKVIVAWVLAFIFATPQLFIFLQVTEDTDGVTKRKCVSKGYTENWQRKVYFTFLTSYILLIPTIVMVFCYSQILHVVWVRAARDDLQSIPGGPARGCEEGLGSPRMSVRRGLVTASKRRVITMTLFVIVGFLVCHTPYFIISLVRIYSDYEIQITDALVASQILVLLHSTLNPVLYGLFTLRQKHFIAMLACLECRKRRAVTGERRHLLNSKFFDWTFKFSNSSQDTEVQTNSDCSSDLVVHKERIASVHQGRAACKSVADSNKQDSKNKVKGRRRGRYHDHGRTNGTNVPLLLITNTAVVSASGAEQDTPSKSVAYEKGSSVTFGPEVNVICVSTHSPVAEPSVSTRMQTQWTTGCVIAENENHTCV